MSAPWPTAAPCLMRSCRGERKQETDGEGTPETDTNDHRPQIGHSRWSDQHASQADGSQRGTKNDVSALVASACCEPGHQQADGNLDKRHR
jgi:hypothetical protein